MTWVAFWGYFLAISLIGFAILSVVVSVRAWFDLRQMLARGDQNAVEDERATLDGD